MHSYYRSQITCSLGTDGHRRGDKIITLTDNISGMGGEQQDEDIIDLTLGSDSYSSDLEVLAVVEKPRKKRIHEEDLDYESDQDSEFDIEECYVKSVAETSQPQKRKKEDTEKEIPPPDNPINETLEIAIGSTVMNQPAVPLAEEATNTAQVALSLSATSSQSVITSGTSEIPEENSSPKVANNSIKSDCALPSISVARSPALSPTHSSDDSTNAEAAASATDATADPAPKRVYELIELLVVSIVPEKPYRKTIPWRSRVPFYRLSNEFTEPIMIIYNGEILKPYMVPAMVNPDSPNMEILLLTKHQYQEIQLSDDPKSRFKEAISGKKEEKAETKSPEDTSNEFPIKLEGALGSVRVMVTPQTRCQQLVEHYMKVKQSPKVRIKFEGDFMDDDATIEEMDLEADEMLDIV